MTQLIHSNTSFEYKKFPIVLILDNMTGPANIGSLFRLADAFNIERIVLGSGSFSDLNSSRLRRTARSTESVVDHSLAENTLEAIQMYSDLDYTVVALEITSDSLPVHKVSFDGISKLVLVLGNENSGISKEVLEMAEKRIHIEMFGSNSSMNVSHAAGIALFEITKSLLPV